MSKERAAWLVRDAGMTPGPEAAVAPGTTGAAVDPGHPRRIPASASTTTGFVGASQVLEIHSRGV